ncbi:carboxylesterase 15 [Spatholobus suberectus]|nr:carboxylesterase 15 [Spatholobus suberectus]
MADFSRVFISGDSTGGNIAHHLAARLGFGLPKVGLVWVRVGDNTDHPLVNPSGPNSKSLEGINLDPILVVAAASDLLKDRTEDYARRLKELGKDIEYVEFEGQQHTFFTIDPNSETSNKLMLIIKQFIEKHLGKD